MARISTPLPRKKAPVGRGKTAVRKDAKSLAKARRLRPRLRLLGQVGTLLLVAAIGGSGYWVVASGRYDAMKDALWHHYLDVTLWGGLEVERIYMDGLNYVNKPQILALIPTYRYQNKDVIPAMGVDIYTLKDAVEDLNWVKTAEVERQFPNGLHIRIVERTPVALWQVNNTLRVIDDTGHVLQEGSIARFSKLPVIVGDEANVLVKPLFDALRSEPWLAAKVSSAVRVGNRRWDVIMQNEVLVKLPQDNMTEAWHHLAQLQREKRVMDRAVKTIDLRLNDRITLQKEGDVPHPVKK